MNIYLYGRSEFQAAFDIHYNCTYFRLLVDYYRNLSKFFDIASLVSGSAAAASLWADCRMAGIVSGIIIAVIQALNLFIRPAESSIRCEHCRQEWTHLMKDAEAQPLETVNARIHDLNAGDAPAVPSLRAFAYNMTLRQNSLDDEPAKVSLWGRLKYAVANL